MLRVSGDLTECKIFIFDMMIKCCFADILVITILLYVCLTVDIS